MVARSDAREADIWPGVSLNDPKSPEAQWLEAVINQCSSPTGRLHRLLHGVTVPSSAPRQPFKPATAEGQPADVARATQIIKETRQKQRQIAAAAAATAAAAQELHILRAAVVAACIPSLQRSIQPGRDLSATQALQPA